MLETSPALVLRWIRGRSAFARATAAGLETARAVARHALPEEWRSGPGADLARRLLSRRERHVLAPLLEAIGHVRAPVFFIQVGSNDGEQQDPLRDSIREFGWSGIMVEPVPYVFERLQRNYERVSGIALENIAVSTTDGEATFHHLAHVAAEDASTVPRWYDALGSFSLDIVRSHHDFIPDIDSRIVSTTVPTLTFESLCARHGVKHLDVLHIDTEGHDFEVLKLVPFERLRPIVVIYEHHHLSSADQAACQELLAHWGYDLVEYGLDTWAFNHAEVGAHEEALTRLWHSLRDQAAAVMAAGRSMSREPEHIRAVIQLSDEDRRYLNSLYDDTEPLPAGAADHLQSGNPRLCDLRAQYEALDAPVVRHSRWTAENLDGFLDLSHFRGDSMYQWHYRELPRATRLKWFIYLGYVRDRDHLGLLDRLVEDGAFGAWTYSFEGQPRVSRDLIESVNELLFLDRHLGLVQGAGQRIVDIGAGYGRLAHRMHEAAPTLDDYCCVDAVPESTFLSEYYLRWRGCTPTARVVPLHELNAAISPGSFDLAINVHSFSECPLDAIEWWLHRLQEWEVRRLFLIPNEPLGMLSTERDGSRRDALPLLERAGFHVTAREPVIDDPAVRELLRIDDHFHLLEAR